MDIEEFCAAAWPRLARSLASFTGDLGVGEELAQEALARAWQHWDRVSEMEAPTMWVYRTGMNLARSRLRRTRLERRVRTMAGPASHTTGPDVADIVSVRHAIAALPDRQRTAVVLRYHADLGVDDTAAVMGCAPGTVKTLTHQALARLRASLDTASEVGEVR